MKKIMIISLSIVLMLGLVACNKNNKEDKSINKEEQLRLIIQMHITQANIISLVYVSKKIKA